jgi:hypothetical protein
MLEPSRHPLLIVQFPASDASSILRIERILAALDCVHL